MVISSAYWYVPRLSQSLKYFSYVLRDTSLRHVVCLTRKLKRFVDSSKLWTRSMTECNSNSIASMYLFLRLPCYFQRLHSSWHRVCISVPISTAKPTIPTERLRELWVIPVFFLVITAVSGIVASVLGWLFKLKHSQRWYTLVFAWRILTNVHGYFRNFAMAAAMFMNSNSLPIALMQSLVVTVPDLRWDSNDNRDAMVGRALTYLVMHSTLGMIVSVLPLLVLEALLRIYSATLELWCSFAFTSRLRSCRIGIQWIHTPIRRFRLWQWLL